MAHTTTVQHTGVSKKCMHGQPGTKRYTTVEIVVDEKPLPVFAAPGGIMDETTIALTIAYGETELRQRVKQVGAKWDPARKVWQLSYGVAR